MSDLEFVNRKHWPSSGHGFKKARARKGEKRSFQLEMRLRNKGTTSPLQVRKLCFRWLELSSTVFVA